MIDAPPVHRHGDNGVEMGHFAPVPMTEERKPMDIKALLAFVVLIGIVLLLPKYWEWIGYEKPKPEPKE